MYIPNSRRPRRSVFCCLIFSLIKFISGFIITIAILILVIWFIFSPKGIIVSIQPASLTRFNATKNSTNHHFNLTSNISIYNPNKRIAAYYDTLESSAFYKGFEFSKVALPSFYQGHKNTTVVMPNFHGRFTDKEASNAYDIEVWLNGKVRFKYGSLATIGGYMVRVKCELKINLLNGIMNGDRYFRRCGVIKFF